MAGPKMSIIKRFHCTCSHVSSYIELVLHKAWSQNRPLEKSGEGLGDRLGLGRLLCSNIVILFYSGILPCHSHAHLAIMLKLSIYFHNWENNSTQKGTNIPACNYSHNYYAQHNRLNPSWGGSVPCAGLQVCLWLVHDCMPTHVNWKYNPQTTNIV